MISNNKPNPKRLVSRYHKMCTLEAIAEEKELETTTKDCIRVGTKRETFSKTLENNFTTNNFTPFMSSWESKGVKTLKTIKSTDVTSKGNLKQQYESLKSDYKELFEFARLQELSKEAIITRLEELEKECQNLRYQAEENFDKLTLERKNAEQIKNDYEFTLETQNRTFKRREKELLEQIDKRSVKIQTDTQTLVENDFKTSAINAFEYEEISEKLESFEKQNKFLQSSKETLELQNRILSDKLAEMEKSQHNKLKIGNNQTKSSSIVDFKKQLTEKEELLFKLNFELSRANDELFVAQERLVEIQNFEMERNKCFQLEKQLTEERISKVPIACRITPAASNLSNNPATQSFYSDNDLTQILVNLQTTIKMQSGNKQFSSSCSRSKHKVASNEVEDSSGTEKSLHNKAGNSNEFEDDSSDNNILNLLQQCLALVNALHQIEKKNTEDGNKPEVENDSLDDLTTVTLEKEIAIKPIKQMENNNMNLSDSEKMNKSNILIESSNDIEVENFDFIIQKLKLRHENDRGIFVKLEQIHENTRATLVKKSAELQLLFEENENLLQNIETLQREGNSQKTEYEKLTNLVQERDDIISKMGSEQMEIHTERANSFEKIKYLQSRIDYHDTRLKELCVLLTDTSNKYLKNENVLLEKTEEMNQSLENEFVVILEEKHMTPGSQRNNIVEIVPQMDNDTSEFDRCIITLKEKLIELKDENKNLKKVISKIKNIETYVKDTLQQIQRLKSDILEAKKGFEGTIKLVKKEIQENIKLYEKKEKFTETDITPKSTKGNKDVREIMQDNFETKENILEKKIQNPILETLSELVQKIKLITDVKVPEEEQICNSQHSLRTKLEDIKNIGNQVIALIQARNVPSGDNTNFIMKEQQTDQIVSKEQPIEDETFYNKVTEIQNWNFNLEDGKGKIKNQNFNQERNTELTMTDEYKKEDKWKLLRTREHDSRRNIDLNTLCFETTVEKCNNCENINSLNQRLKTEVVKLKNRYETRKISQ